MRFGSEEKGGVRAWLSQPSVKLRRAFAAVALAFVLYAAQDLFRRWDGSPVRVDLGIFVLSCGLAGLGMWIQLLAFRSLLGRFTPTQPALRVLGSLYMDSQMARYTPGKVGLVAVRVSGASKVQVTARQMGAALLMELLSWCAVGTLVATGLLAIALRGEFAESVSTWPFGSLALGGLACGSALGLLALVSVPRRHWPAFVTRLLGEEGAEPLLPLGVVGFHVVHFLVWAGCGVSLAASVGAASDTWLLSAGLVPASIVLGFLAFLAPAGVGVREAVILAGLSPVLGPSVALSVGLLARVASLLSDVLLWIFSRFYARRG